MTFVVPAVCSAKVSALSINTPEVNISASGIRVGTPAITTRNMGSNEMKKIASFINAVVTDADNDDTIQNVKSQVKELCDSFPIYEESSH